MAKSFRLSAEQIKPLATGHGSCLASNQILFEGLPVRFMYRESPDNKYDSGWRFFSGFEEDEYVNNPENIAIYDVNTIANYDPSIIPFLKAAVGKSFEKPLETYCFIEVVD